MTHDPIEEQIKQFVQNFKLADGSYNGAGLYLWEGMRPLIRTALKEADARGEKRERASWINQPANQHDARIRKDERERIAKALLSIEKLDRHSDEDAHFFGTSHVIVMRRSDYDSFYEEYLANAAPPDAAS